jgi:hypothetical protein
MDHAQLCQSESTLFVLMNKISAREEDSIRARLRVFEAVLHKSAYLLIVYVAFHSDLAEINSSDKSPYRRFFYSKLPAFLGLLSDELISGISLDELLHVGVEKFDKLQAEILRGGAHNQKQVLLRLHNDVLKLSRRHTISGFPASNCFRTLKPYMPN